MIRIGFIGRTKMLFDTISIFRELEEFEISFIWTCKDEEYYQFGVKKFEIIANKIKCQYINSPNILKYLDSVEADIVISINFINLIPKKFINKFKFGVLNAHTGDLPKYRGNACPNWAIINGEKFITLSIHLMDANLDSGPIVLKKKFNLTKHTYITEIYEWLQIVIPKSFIKAVKALIKGGLTNKQKGKVLRTFPRKPEDSRLDFCKDLEWNYRLIRASSRPFSGAYAFLNDSNNKVTIFKAQPDKVKYDFCAVSGQIIEKAGKEYSFLIAIGKEVLRITDYSINGCSKKDSFKIVCRSLRNRLT